MYLKIAMQHVCDSDSRCSLARDASARDAKSLAMWVERNEPPSSGTLGQILEGGRRSLRSVLVGPSGGKGFEISPHLSKAEHSLPEEAKHCRAHDETSSPFLWEQQEVQTHNGMTGGKTTAWGTFVFVVCLPWSWTSPKIHAKFLSEHFCDESI